MLSRTALTVLLSLTLFVAIGGTSSGGVPPTLWPHEVAGLPPHPAVTFGHLPNGMRFAWRRSFDGTGRVSAHLHVAGGSLGERQGQRGMTYFLQHLALCDGDGGQSAAAAWAREHGVEVRIDHTVWTDAQRSVYEFELPTNDEALLAGALRSLGMFVADRAIPAREIERVRQRIDVEERQRDEARWHAAVARRSFEVGEELASRCDPFGTSRDRSAFDGESLQAFARARHDPRRLTLVVVGDLVDDPRAEIEAAFGDLRTTSPLRDDPPVSPEFGAEVLVHRDDRLARVEVRLGRVHVAEPRFPTLDELVEQMPLWVACEALNLRLGALSDAMPIAVEDASFVRLKPVRAAPRRGVELRLTTSATRFREAFLAAVAQVRSALERGFAVEEIIAARRLVVRRLEIEADRDAGRLSWENVRWLLAAVDGAGIDHDPAALCRSLRGPLDAVDEPAARAALQGAWRDAVRQLSVVGPTAEGAEDRAAVRKLLREAWSGEVEPVDPRWRRFAYSSDDTPAGEIVSRDYDAEQRIHRVVFENGVRLFVHYVPSLREATRVMFGDGRARLAGDDWIRAWVVERTFASFGFGAHSESAWRRLMEGHDTGFAFELRDRWWQNTGNCAVRDHRRQCELLAAALADPGFRVSGLRSLREGAAEQVAAALDTPEELLGVRFWEQLEVGRIVCPDQESIAAMEMEDLRAWFEPVLRETPVDVVAWGGVAVEETIDHVARTFGALPARPAIDRGAAFDAALRSGLRVEIPAPPEASHAAIEIVHPIPSSVGERERFLLPLLGEVVARRLRDSPRLSRAHVRVEDGAARPGSGYASIYLPCLPDDVDKSIDECTRAVASLVDRGASSDEVDRARAAVIARHDQRYHLEVLSDLRTDPAAVANHGRRRRALASATAADVTRLARDTLLDEGRSIGVVRPRKD